jgi:hypothetical protein
MRNGNSKKGKKFTDRKAIKLNILQGIGRAKSVQWLSKRQS